MPVHDLTQRRPSWFRRAATAEPAARPTPPFVPGYPLVGNAPDFRRDPIALLRRGYEQFGPVFAIRLGARRAAVIVGPRYQRLFFEETDRALSMAEVYRAFVPIFGDGFALVASPEEYREQRAIMQAAFSPARMPEYLSVIVERTLTRIDLMGNSGEFELCDTIEELCLEAVSCALMGADFRRRMQPDFWRLYRDIVGALDFVLPPNLPLPKFRRRDRARTIVHERIASMIADRRAAPGTHDDFIQTLADARWSSGELLPVERLQSMILFMVFSATESTPLQASWTLIQLLQHPEYLNRVIEEQDAALGRTTAGITLASIAHLNRLQWAIKETERMRPTITMLWRHTVEEYEVDGYRVPRGWATVICPPLAHRLPDVFDNPDVYDPERFSPERAEDRRVPHGMVCFGGGAHKCPGMSIAYLLMKAIFSLLLQRYELTLATADPQPDFSTSITRPGKCTVRYRRR